MKRREVYFDHNATTPLYPEVVDTIRDNLTLFGNASSVHHFGYPARVALENSRKVIAEFINAEPEEIIFTSCGSESNNLAIKGASCLKKGCVACTTQEGHHIITTAIEHPSVMNTCKCLEMENSEVTYLPVDSTGLVNPGDVERSIKRNTVLVSVMFGNNEIGTIEPIEDIAKIAHEHRILCHTDAVQAVGKIPIDVQKLDVDILSFSGHKINAPKGVGGLYVRKDTPLCPLVHGGHQEKGIRGGTENTLGIIALGKAIEVAARNMDSNNAELRRLRDRLQKGIEARIDDVYLNGHPEKRLPGTLNMTFKYIEGESILLALDNLGVAVSTGSACSSGSLEASPVLLALGISPVDAKGSIRFSLGYGNKEEDVDYVLDILPGIIRKLRKLSPLNP
jgi:cysteine desulfurase